MFWNRPLGAYYWLASFPEHGYSAGNIFRVFGCQPRVAAVYNFVNKLALSMATFESVRIYQATSDGTVDKLLRGNVRMLGRLGIYTENLDNRQKGFLGGYLS